MSDAELRELERAAASCAWIVDALSSPPEPCGSRKLARGGPYCKQHRAKFVDLAGRPRVCFACGSEEACACEAPRGVLAPRRRVSWT